MKTLVDALIISVIAAVLGSFCGALNVFFEGGKTVGKIPTVDLSGFFLTTAEYFAPAATFVGIITVLMVGVTAATVFTVGVIVLISDFVAPYLFNSPQLAAK